MKKQNKLTEHQANLVNEAHMRLNVIAGNLMNAEIDRKVTHKMSQASSDIGDILSRISTFYRNYK